MIEFHTLGKLVSQLTLVSFLCKLQSCFHSESPSIDEPNSRRVSHQTLLDVGSCERYEQNSVVVGAMGDFKVNVT